MNIVFYVQFYVIFEEMLFWTNDIEKKVPKTLFCVTSYYRYYYNNINIGKIQTQCRTIYTILTKNTDFIYVTFWYVQFCLFDFCFCYVANNKLISNDVIIVNKFLYKVVYVVLIVEINIYIYTYICIYYP